MHVYTSKSFRNEHRHRKQVFHNSGMWTNCVIFCKCGLRDSFILEAKSPNCLKASMSFG
uniref:Uncharacterized protein n=1 Tax=Meloidogyne incognita TaxID=6306 RepID=A0A914KK24_MELIC